MISGVVITYNEEDNIQKCIESMASVVDEIVVLDSFSTDRTPDICRKLGAKFYQQKFEGYGKQKQDAVALASHDYILSLDADEVLSPELAGLIAQERKKGLADAYSFNRRNLYCGKYVRHCGWYPDRKVRLFNRKLMNWSGIVVHETVSVPDSVSVVRLDADILHHTFDSCQQHLDSSLGFAALSAKQRSAAGKRPNLPLALLQIPFRFLVTYLAKLGFLDGLNGLRISYVSAIYSFHKYWWKN